MNTRTSAPEFDAETTRRLVANDPFLAYAVVRHAGEAEEHWLQQVFKLEVRSDPALRYRYRAFLREPLPRDPVPG